MPPSPACAWRPASRARRGPGAAAASKPSSSSSPSDAPPARTLPALRAALELAVAEEDYAEAARLRDAMK
jgi:protein-arginine kinase activator protein McsA